MARPRVHQAVLSHLAGRVLSGELAPGEAFPNTDELTASLGVSRSALREAIKVLGAKGLVIVRPRLGTRVRRREHWNLLDPELLSWCGSSVAPELLRDLLDYRRLVEPGAAALAAERASATEVAMIEQAYERMRAAPNLDALVTADLEFHGAVLAASGNVFLAQWANALAALLLAEFRQSAGDGRDLAEASQAHREVIEAIRLREPARARAAYVALLALAEQGLARQAQTIGFPGALT